MKLGKSRFPMANSIDEWVKETKAKEESLAKQPLAVVPSVKPGAIDEAVQAIMGDAYLWDAIGFNELSSAPYVRGVLPWADMAETRQWSDTDDSQLFAYLQSNYGIKSEKNVEHAFRIVCDKTKFNPLIDNFNALPEWDGVERAGHLFTWFLGAADTPYTKAVERLFLAGAIARTYHPGTKFDYMPVLIGGQGIGKSTLVRKLALEDAYFTDDVTGIGSKEAAEIAQGKLIVEIPELSAIKGKDLEAVKAFISRVSDDYRPPYAKRTEQHPRRFVLIGTTNTRFFLRDATGNRRYLPITCGVSTPTHSLFDENAVCTIAQTWAEMLVEYKAGNLPIILSPTMEQEAAKQQEGASVDDPRIGLIGEYLETSTPGERVCVVQIVEEALDIARSKQQTYTQNEVRGILERNYPEWQPCEKKQRVGEYGIQRAYQKQSATA